LTHSWLRVATASCATGWSAPGSTTRAAAVTLSTARAAPATGSSRPWSLGVWGGGVVRLVWGRSARRLWSPAGS